MANMQSIGKITDVIHNVKRQTYYVETLQDGTVVTDESRDLPVLTFKGTTKLHGTFAGIKYNAINQKLTAMSKKDDITPEQDNAGFAMFVETHKEYFIDMLRVINRTKEISIMGEWAGPGIQKGVGINLIPEKSFFMFGIKYVLEDEDSEEDGETFWIDFPETVLSTIADKGPKNLYSVFDFKTWEQDVDFNKPQEAIAIFEKIMNDVDESCPVAESLGFKGHGEGVVWVSDCCGNRLIFKEKGDSHSIKTPRQPKEKDPREQEKLDFADMVTPGWRLEQGVQEICDTNNGGILVMKDMGNVIKWVLGDIAKEETTLFKEFGFSLKDIQKYVSAIVRDYIKQEILLDAMK